MGNKKLYKISKNPSARQYKVYMERSILLIKIYQTNGFVPCILELWEKQKNSLKPSQDLTL